MRKTKTVRIVFARILLLAMVAVMGMSVVSCGTQKTTEGTRVFTFEVYDLAGTKTLEKQISTEKATVGEALLDEGLIAGDEGPFGLYIKTVGGVLADYDVDGTYWGFYIDGEMAMSGVDATAAEEGRVYSLRISK